MVRRLRPLEHVKARNGASGRVGRVGRGGGRGHSYIGAPDAPATRGYFLALVDVFTRTSSYPCHLPTMLNLILYKTADPSQPIRKSGTPRLNRASPPAILRSSHLIRLGSRPSAVQLLQLIEERFFLASIGADYRVSITSALPTTYRQSQQILSNRLAEDHPALAYELLTETTRRADRAPKVRSPFSPTRPPHVGSCARAYPAHVSFVLRRSGTPTRHVGDCDTVDGQHRAHGRFDFARCAAQPVLPDDSVRRRVRCGD